MPPRCSALSDENCTGCWKSIRFATRNWPGRRFPDRQPPAKVNPPRMPRRPDRPETLNILVVDDDEDTRANLRDLLELDEYRVQTAANFADAMERMRTGAENGNGFDVLIVDR